MVIEQSKVEQKYVNFFEMMIKNPTRFPFKFCNNEICSNVSSGLVNFSNSEDIITLIVVKGFPIIF